MLGYSSPRNAGQIRLPIRCSITATSPPPSVHVSPTPDGCAGMRRWRRKQPADHYTYCRWARWMISCKELNIFLYRKLCVQRFCSMQHCDGNELRWSMLISLNRLVNTISPSTRCSPLSFICHPHRCGKRPEKVLCFQI